MSRVFNILLLVIAAPALASAEAPSPAPAPGAPPSAGLSVSAGGASVEVRLPATMVPKAWSANSEPGPLFAPDVYPSEAEAARGAGELWAVRAADRWQHEPHAVRIYCCDPSLYAAVAEGVRARLPDARVEKASAAECPSGYYEGSPGEGQAWLVVEDTPAAPTHGDERATPAGQVMLSSKGVADADVLVRFVPKPWVLNPGALEGRGRRWVVGRTDPMKPAMTEAEASGAARAAAVEDVVRLVRGRIGGPVDEGWLRRRVEEKLAGGALVVDQFPQKFERRVGSTWRSAVLLDASDGNVNRLAGELRAERHAEQKSFLMSTASAAGVLLVTYVLYRLANAFTRGYFVWSLRTAAAVVATGAVVLLLMVIG